jgi:hypothetical protein
MDGKPSSPAAAADGVGGIVQQLAVAIVAAAALLVDTIQSRREAVVFGEAATLSGISSF